jgi:cyclic pyranopterin phosphate synthase
MPRHEILSYEEIALVVSAAAEMGISKIRISGGEPLVREGVLKLIEMLSGIQGIDDLALTTNGVLLASQAEQLVQAGLKRINISLDTLRPARFKDITGFDRLDDVMKGIEEAHRAGLEPVKANVVVMRGINDDELADFARLTKDGWNVRFIELMPLIGRGKRLPEFVSAREMWDRLSSLGELQACSAPQGNGPAKYYRFDGARGTLGFITPVSEHFCFRCNRLRLTADGKLLPCLLADEAIDIRSSLRSEASTDEIRRLILEAVVRKPRGHQVAQGLVPEGRTMTQVGG